MTDLELFAYVWVICVLFNALNLFLLDLTLKRFTGYEMKPTWIGYFNLAPKDTPINRKYIINIMGYVLAPAAFLVISLSSAVILPCLYAKAFYKTMKEQIRIIKELRGKNDVKKAKTK